MGDVLIALLPLIAGATLVPIYPIVVLLLLQNKGGLAGASAFVAGAVMVRLVQGILFGFVFGTAIATHSDDSAQVIANTLLLVIGILLLIAAYKKQRKQPDPDDPPPQWMANLGGLSGLKAFGAGALFTAVSVKQWVFTLTAIDVILGAELGVTSSVALYLLFILATQVLVLLPIVGVAVAPQWSAQPLTATQAWLERNNRVIVVTVSLVFGVWFLYQGISGLIA
jgi:hypothetical protein